MVLTILAGGPAAAQSGAEGDPTLDSASGKEAADVFWLGEPDTCSGPWVPEPVPPAEGETGAQEPEAAGGGMGVLSGCFRTGGPVGVSVSTGLRSR